MSEAPGQPPPNSGTLTWTLSILAALLAYVLSIGPVVCLCEKHIIPNPPPQWVINFYLPVVLIGETPLKKPFDTYIEWWAGLAHNP